MRMPAAAWTSLWRSIIVRLPVYITIQCLRYSLTHLTIAVWYVVCYVRVHSTTELCAMPWMVIANPLSSQLHHSLHSNMQCGLPRPRYIVSILYWWCQAYIGYPNFWILADKGVAVLHWLLSVLLKEVQVIFSVVSYHLVILLVGIHVD